MFRKTARVASLGTFDVAADGNIRIAQLTSAAEGDTTTSEAPRSYYLDGARKLDVRALMERVAETYAISPDPSHYFFEAIRANTTNCPNENNDGFHQSELLFFNTKLGMPVYMTYAGKPHHLNHKTENPKAARGLIIDAHYNTDSPPLDTCPSCQTRTAERQNRDETGLHCRKCGTMVKDEFVEILVGIDAKKDPLFADGVRKGVLKAGSMGCNCLSTTCNVCGHVAYSRPEFCEHIRSGNKGTLWVRQGHQWSKTRSADVAKELRRRKLAFVPRDFCYVKLPDFEVRKAFEYCVGVIFDEYSRVDQPADPKALQVEILKAAQLLGIPDSEALRNETEALIRSAEKKRKEFEDRMRMVASHQRVAGKFYVVRINSDPSDTHAGSSLEEALDLAMPDDTDSIEYGLVDAPDAGAARLAEPDAWMPVPDEPVAEASMHQEGLELQIQPGDEPLTITPPGSEGEPGAVPGQPGPGAPGGPQGIDQYTEQELSEPTAPGGESMDLGEMGVLPVAPGASAPRRSSARRPNMKYQAAYQQWVVQVSEQGNARLLSADKTPVLVFKAERATQDPQARKAFGKKVLSHLLNHGLVATAKKFKGFFTPKFAQVVEGGMNDMQGYDDHFSGSVLEGGREQNDLAGDLRGQPPSNMTSSSNDQDDMSGDVRGTPPSSTQDDAAMDHDHKDQSVDSAVGENHETMRDKRTPFNMMKNDVLKGEVHDHVEPLSSKKGEIELGAYMAEKRDAPKFRLVGKRLGKDGLEYELESESGASRRVAATALETWIMLDKTPGTLKLPADRTAAEKCGKCGEAMEGEKCAKCAAKAAARRDQFATAKLARAEKLAADAKVAHEAELVAAQEAAVAAFCRGLRIAAARQSVDLEESPLKLAAEAVLSEPREIGKDAASGEPIVWDGLDSELTRYLVAQLYEIGHGDHLEALIRRAGELVTKGDQYLLDAESDLRNVQAQLPEITNVRVAEVDDLSLHAMELRAQARSGNLQFNPAPSEEAVNANGQHDRRAAIRGALGGTLVGAARGRLGLPN